MPAASLAFDPGQCATATPSGGQQPDVGVGELHAVRGEHPPAEHAEPVEQRRHRAVRGALRGVLLRRLGHVDVQQRAPLPGVLARPTRSASAGSVYAACGP